MKLKHNPFDIFCGNKTPAGLYARQKWLDESSTLAWQDDFKETVRSLMNGQSRDGSWGQSPVESIRRLFGLHLTVRNMNQDIAGALNWLVKNSLNKATLIMADSPPPMPCHLFQGLPFTSGHTDLFLISATLFLTSVFQQSGDPLLMARYKFLCRWITENEYHTEKWLDINNVLRALIVHPEYAASSATASIIDHLGEIQNSSGSWPAPVPFFQTINALAHSKLPSAHRQWMKASAFLYESQNGDGTWGTEDREWNTFLVVHALKNKTGL